MKLYSATVRLKGNLLNEVVKTYITAAEIVVLQRKHGADAVVRVTEIGEVRRRSDRRERERLANLYKAGLSADGQMRLHGVDLIDSIFGVGSPLPQEYKAISHDPDDENSPEPEEEEEVIIRDGEPRPTMAAAGGPEVVPTEPIRRGRPPRAAPIAEEAAA